MSSAKRWVALLVLLAGGGPLVTCATCDRYGPLSGSFDVYSSNDDLVQDVFDLFCCDDDDDD
jgi:hypothetical protein